MLLNGWAILRCENTERGSSVWSCWIRSDMLSVENIILFAPNKHMWTGYASISYFTRNITQKIRTVQITLRHSCREIRNLNIAHHGGTEYTEKGIMNHLKTRIVSGPSGLEALKYSGLTAHSLHSFENMFTTETQRAQRDFYFRPIFSHRWSGETTQPSGQLSYN